MVLEVDEREAEFFREGPHEVLLANDLLLDQDLSKPLAPLEALLVDGLRVGLANETRLHDEVIEALLSPGLKGRAIVHALGVIENLAQALSAGGFLEDEPALDLLGIGKPLVDEHLTDGGVELTTMHSVGVEEVLEHVPVRRQGEPIEPERIGHLPGLCLYGDRTTAYEVDAISRESGRWALIVAGRKRGPKRDVCNEFPPQDDTLGAGGLLRVVALERDVWRIGREGRDPPVHDPPIDKHHAYGGWKGAFSDHVCFKSKGAFPHPRYEKDCILAFHGDTHQTAGWSPTMLMTRGPNFTKPPPPELTSASDADRAMAERMAATMRSVIESGRYKPPILPEVAVRLSHLANEPEARIEDVESAVSRDPAVAGKVVSVANSALNARGMAITSLRGSIMRLGIFQIRDIAFQVVANARLFKVPAYNPRMKELLESSQAAGVMAREVGKVRGAEIEAAYLCGLLHDIGEVTILAILGDAAKAKNEQPPPLSKLALVIDAYHAQIGRAHV